MPHPCCSEVSGALSVLWSHLLWGTSAVTSSCWAEVIAAQAPPLSVYTRPVSVQNLFPLLAAPQETFLFTRGQGGFSQSREAVPCRGAYVPSARGSLLARPEQKLADKCSSVGAH